MSLTSNDEQRIDEIASLMAERIFERISERLGAMLVAVPPAGEEGALLCLDKERESSDRTSTAPIPGESSSSIDSDDELLNRLMARAQRNSPKRSSTKPARSSRG